MKTKSAKNVCDSLVGFIGEMGYMQTITVAHDNEPVVKLSSSASKTGEESCWFEACGSAS